MENSMPAAAIPYDDSQPGLHFGPSDEEIIELYLLPRVRGQPDLFCLSDLIIDDESAANTQPWELFRRHRRSRKFPAFFFVRTKNARADERPERTCRGGGYWKSQKSKERGNMLVLENGEKIGWKRNNLNFHMEKGSGSVGWVMHEFTIPKCSSLRLCQISFSGYGKKRMREPDGFDDSLAADEPVPQRPRVAQYESGSTSTSACASWTVAENAQQPNWALQEQLQIMEQADQDPANDCAVPDPLDSLSVEKITEINNCYPELPAHDDSASGSTKASFSQDAIAAQAFQVQDPASATCAASWSSTMEIAELFSEEEIAEMTMLVNELPPFERQFEEAGTTKQNAEQDAVPHMESMATGGQNTVTWEGFEFDLS